MLFQIYSPCLTSSRYLCPCFATVDSVAFCNAWDHRAAPWMAQATIKLFKLEWSAVGRLLSQGRLTICTLWNWSSTKYMTEEEQQSDGLECMEASTCIWGPAFQTLCFATGCISRAVTCKWSQSRHFLRLFSVFVCFGLLGGFFGISCLFVCAFYLFCFVCLLPILAEQFYLEFTYAVYFYFSEENRLTLAVCCKYACKCISVWIHLLPMLRQGCLGALAVGPWEISSWVSGKWTQEKMKGTSKPQCSEDAIGFNMKDVWGQRNWVHGCMFACACN